VMDNLNGNGFWERPERCRKCLESLLVGDRICEDLVILVSAQVRAEPDISLSYMA